MVTKCLKLWSLALLAEVAAFTACYGQSVMRSSPAAESAIARHLAECQPALRAAQQGNPSSAAAAITCLSLQTSQATYDGNCSVLDMGIIQAKNITDQLDKPFTPGTSNATYAAVLGGYQANRAIATVPPCSDRFNLTNAILENASVFCAIADSAARDTGSPTDEATAALCYTALAVAASRARNCASSSLAAAAASNAASIARALVDGVSTTALQQQADEAARFVTVAAAAAAAAATSCNAALSSVAGDCKGASTALKATAQAASEAMRGGATISNKNITGVARAFETFAGRVSEIAASNAAKCVSASISGGGERTTEVAGQITRPNSTALDADPQ